MLKFICKVLFIAISCTHFALAYDEMSLQSFLEQKQNAEQEWLEWLVIKRNSHIENLERAKKEYDFAKKHFKPIWYRKGVNKRGENAIFYACHNNEAVRICQYKLIAPLKLKGILTIKTNYDEAEGCDFTPIDTYFKSKDFPEGHFLNITDLQVKASANNQKELQSKLPKWLQEGFAGEVSYEVEFEVANSKKIGWREIDEEAALLVDYSACGGNSYLVADKIKLIKKLDEKRYEGVKYYMGYEAQRLSFMQIIVDDDFVNIRQSPNGKIVAKIDSKDFKNAIIIALSADALNERFGLENSQNSKWHKIMYFKSKDEAKLGKKGIIGYIHNSQIKPYESLDDFYFNVWNE